MKVNSFYRAAQKFHRGEAELRNTCDEKKTLRYKATNEKKDRAKKIYKKTTLEN